MPGRARGGDDVRLPAAAHQTRPWVIHRITADFRLLDVWALPVEGERAEFEDVVQMMASFDPARSDSTATRALFAVRYRLGEWFGWDDAGEPRPIPGCAETSLSARLPRELRGSADGLVPGGTRGDAAAAFVPLYRTADEWAAEISNGTVHGVLHVGWAALDDGRYRAQMGVYVKPRGRLGQAYLRLIAPFRHTIVYPALMQQVGRMWRERRG